MQLLGLKDGWEWGRSKRTGWKARTIVKGETQCNKVREPVATTKEPAKTRLHDQHMHTLICTLTQTEKNIEIYIDWGDRLVLRRGRETRIKSQVGRQTDLPTTITDTKKHRNDISAQSTSRLIRKHQNLQVPMMIIIFIFQLEMGRKQYAETIHKL